MGVTGRFGEDHKTVPVNQFVSPTHPFARFSMVKAIEKREYICGKAQYLPAGHVYRDQSVESILLVDSGTGYAAL